MLILAYSHTRLDDTNIVSSASQETLVLFKRRLRRVRRCFISARAVILIVAELLFPIGVVFSQFALHQGRRTLPATGLGRVVKSDLRRLRDRAQAYRRTSAFSSNRCLRTRIKSFKAGDWFVFFDDIRSGFAGAASPRYVDHHANISCHHTSRNVRGSPINEPSSWCLAHSEPLPSPSAYRTVVRCEIPLLAADGLCLPA